MNSAYLGMSHTSGAGDGLATVLRRQRRQVARLACSGKSDYISEEGALPDICWPCISQHRAAGSKPIRFQLKTMSTRVGHTGSEDRGFGRPMSTMAGGKGRTTVHARPSQRRGWVTSQHSRRACTEGPEDRGDWRTGVAAQAVIGLLLGGLSSLHALQQQRGLFQKEMSTASASAQQATSRARDEPQLLPAPALFSAPSRYGANEQSA